MFNKLQRYSIRKLTIGAASVLIGVTFLGIDTEIVHAETTPTSEETITEQNESQSDVEKNNAENHETSDSRKAGGGDTEQNTNNENNKKIEVEKGDTVDDSSLILRTAKDVDKTTQTNKNNSTENNLEQAQNKTGQKSIQPPSEEQNTNNENSTKQQSTNTKQIDSVTNKADDLQKDVSDSKTVQTKTDDRKQDQNPDIKDIKDTAVKSAPVTLDSLTKAYTELGKNLLQ